MRLLWLRYQKKTGGKPEQQKHTQQLNVLCYTELFGDYDWGLTQPTLGQIRKPLIETSPMGQRVGTHWDAIFQQNTKQTLQQTNTQQRAYNNR